LPSLIKQKYWDISRELQQWKNILLGNDHTFRDIVLKDRLRSPKAVVPVSGEMVERAAAAFMCFLSQKLFTDSSIL